MEKLNLDFSYNLVETNLKTSKKTICKTFWGYAEAKKHLKEFYEFLLDEKLEIIKSLKIKYSEIGYTQREINSMINSDIKCPLLHTRNTILMDDGYKYEIVRAK